MKTKIFICHYPPLSERKNYLDTILPKLKVPYEYSTMFTTYDPSIEKYFSIDEKDFKFKNEFTPVKCWRSTLTNGLKALCMEHINIYKKINDEELDFGIILEDDAVFVDDIEIKFQDMLNNLPSMWDVIYFTNGCETRDMYLQQNRDTTVPVINNFVKMKVPQSWTGGAYIIKRNTAALFKENIRPIIFPPDYELNYLQSRFNSIVYWLEEPIVYEGSSTYSGKYFRYPSSVNR
jgi:GR25 family glycosyltransferase involved in LPS biosynthesis